MLLKDEFAFLPKSKIKAGEGKDEGTYPFFTSSDIKVKRIDNYLFDDELVILGTGGMPSCNYYNGKFSVSTDNFVLKTNGKIKPKYLYYFLRRENLAILAAGFRGTGLKHISKEYAGNIDIPYSSLEKQNEIISVGDTLISLIKECEHELLDLDELIKSRFIELFENQNFSLRAIGEISSFCSRGKSPNYVENSNLLVINQACIYWDELKIENVKYNEDTYEGDRILMRNDILINSTGTGTLGRCNVFNVDDGNRYMADSHVTILRLLGQINPIYFKYWFKSERTQSCIYSDCINGSTNQIELSREKLRKVEIPLPPIEHQNEFATFVESVDKLKFSCGLYAIYLFVFPSKSPRLTFR